MIDSVTVCVDVGGVAPIGVRRIVADVFFDVVGEDRSKTAIVCLPGGGTTRRYFDLLPPDDDASYSVVRSLVGQGRVFVTMDPPGVGASDSPRNPYDLTPHIVSDVCAAAAQEILDRLRHGTITPDLPARPSLVPVGLGFSAGALLTVIVQARHQLYEGLVLIGFHGRGLPQALPGELLDYGDNPERLRKDLVDLTRGFFGDPLPVLPTSNTEVFFGGAAPSEFATAMREAQSPLLGLVGFTTLVPGAVREELEVIDVPVFVGVGEHDIASRAREMPVELPASRDVTVFELAGAGHEQLLAPNRAVLLKRISWWLEIVERHSTNEVLR